MITGTTKRIYQISAWFAGWTLCLFSAPAFSEPTVEESLKAGSEAMGRGFLAEAEQHFTQVTNRTEATRLQRATAFAGRCAVHYKNSLTTNHSELIPQAISDCDQAISLKSDMQQAYRIRGVAMLSAGFPDRAAEDLSVAVALNPDDYLSFQNRALALVKLNRAQEAMTELDSAIRLKPEHPWSYYSRGRLRVAQGDYEASIDDFITFIRFKRDHEEVYRLRGISRLLIGLPQQAVGDFYESLRLRPNNNPDALFLRGMTFFLLDRFVEAEQDLVAALKMQPNHTENRLWLYLTRERIGKPGSAILTDPAAKKDVANWPEALVAVFLGEATAEQGLEVARLPDNPVESQLREHLTLLLLGLNAQIKGHGDEASKWLGMIKSDTKREVPYSRIAQQILRHAVPSETKVAALPTPPYPPQSLRSSTAQSSLAPKSTATAEPVVSPESKPPVLPKADEAVRKPIAESAPAPSPKAVTVPEKKPSKADLKAVTAPESKPTVAKAEPVQAATQPKTVTDQEIKGKFAFKVGSYSQIEYAKSAMAQYTNIGLPVFLEQGKIQEKIMQRVWVGPFDDRAAAEKGRERVRGLPNQSPTEIVQR
ncbi:MAG: tetratricopeptide repeat protein [Magnetococcales bacterium]|nr:tetratricopeptide repeat protein [Magnetococcales bacterium]